MLVRFEKGSQEDVWETDFEDVQRQKYHETKMHSKDLRPQQQLAISGLPAGKVLHITSTEFT